MLYQHFDKLKYDAALQKDKHRDEAEMTVTPSRIT